MGLCVVLRHATALSVHKAAVELRAGVALVGGLVVPNDGLCVVLRYAQAAVVNHSEVRLRAGVTLLGQRTDETHCHRIVTALKRRNRVIKRPCDSCAGQGDQENAAGEETSRRGAPSGGKNQVAKAQSSLPIAA